MIGNLAVLGGQPAFQEPLHVGRPNIGNRTRLLEQVGEVLDSRRLTNRGPQVREFERRIAAELEVEHCVAMCNGTVALEIAIRALAMKGEVIVPSMTFVATAHALQWQQITPVFCDVDPETHTLDSERVASMITPQTTGIIGVHLWGRPCQTDALEALAEQHGLALVFDAAHAFGCHHRGRPIGDFGDAEALSFHATKVLNSFEGGAVVTSNAELAEKMRLMQNFGFCGYDNVIHVGTNGKMNEVSAVMGINSLESLGEFIEQNRRNYHRYLRGLGDFAGISLLRFDESEPCNFHYVVVEVDEQLCGLDRDTVLEVLHAENVLARRYFYPGCHRMEPYRSAYPDAHRLLPETERILARVLVLPTGTATATDDVDVVCTLIREAVERADEVRGAVAAGHRE